MNRRVIAAGLALLCLHLPACDGGGASPDATVTAFLEAGRNGDRNAAISHLVENERSATEADPTQLDVKKAADMDYSMGTATVEGDRATVPVTMKDGDQSQEMTFVVLREQGVWKISMEETLKETLGFSMEEMAAQMAQSMQGSMEQMGQGMADGMEEMTREMGEAMKNLEPPDEK